MRSRAAQWSCAGSAAGWRAAPTMVATSAYERRMRCWDRHASPPEARHRTRRWGQPEEVGRQPWRAGQMPPPGPGPSGCAVSLDLNHPHAAVHSDGIERGLDDVLGGEVDLGDLLGRTVV